MTLLEKTYNAVAHISASKALEHKAPTHAILLEIVSLLKNDDRGEVTECLRVLVRSKRVIYGKTINDFYFKINLNEKQG